MTPDERWAALEERERRRVRLRGNLWLIGLTTLYLAIAYGAVVYCKVAG